MNIFRFTQNNTGGVFDFTDKLTHWVYIEADSPQEANSALKNLGGYFDGVSSDRDCSCCGDRWYSVDDHNKDEYPDKIQLESETQALVDTYGHWAPKGQAEAYIYYKDGNKVSLFTDKVQ